MPSVWLSSQLRLCKERTSSDSEEDEEDEKEEEEEEKEEEDEEGRGREGGMADMRNGGTFELFPPSIYLESCGPS